MNTDYPEEWNELPRHERKKKLKALKREREQKTQKVSKIRNLGLVAIVLAVGLLGYLQLTKRSPEQAEFDQQVKEISLEGIVEEFSIEGRDHVPPETVVEYQTNPPTSGAHLAEAEKWGVFQDEIDDKAAVHSLEHGGIWITYKDVSDEEKEILEEIGRENPFSTIVSPRSENDVKIAVVSWGKMMKLETADKAIIQRYINSYKNQSPERLAR